MTERELRIKMIALITYMTGERQGTDAEQAFSMDELGEMPIPALWTVFRALVNTREPKEGHPKFYETQDEVLRHFIYQDNISTADDAQAVPGNSKMRLWRGDITRLAVDAIVNAANSQMQGCWVPGHNCIDNAIHTFAGVQLREECARIIADQGHEEPTGRAKVTAAYNLPCEHVIHTVGPVANGKPTDAHRRELASCYASCLEAARSCGAKSIAFCSISTGVFGFPQEEAAPIAVSAVSEWLELHSTTDLTVVFNVFSEDDERVYRDVLGISSSD